ncbi:hypothetical protein FRACA_570033 [Frankia canadensis]|uniref:Uncharacterized protein n=1 Tax=Frankia canadensis TaxID=1836972 RepID=A0A2I2KZ65_9ACTN|nr:hypothetical protein FRACA_570033 [Frankia canadensis]SOU58239.1 hypothetical protein FRACA_570033 [Frankia canadensis]
MALTIGTLLSSQGAGASEQKPRGNPTHAILVRLAKFEERCSSVRPERGRRALAVPNPSEEGFRLRWASAVSGGFRVALTERTLRVDDGRRQINPPPRCVIYITASGMRFDVMF